MTTLIFSLWLTTCPASVAIPNGDCSTARFECERMECMEIIDGAWGPDRWVAGAVLVRVD